MNGSLQSEDRGKNSSEPGKLKIFFGYAPGVGKTCAMLKAARCAGRSGADVAVGWAELHGRPETARLLEGLEQLPPLTVRCQETSFREFDLDAALRRKPRILLVDELAHANAPGCRHRKRYQDVEELLRAGIDVYTTVNVQHLESLNDVISSLTGTSVQERVPDWVFDSAWQVELVDMEPDELIARLERGEVCGEEQARQALSSFFTRRNLTALRELAFRRVADRLNRSSQGAGEGPSAGEQILICLSPSPSNAKVIRAAARMSEALNARFTALFVETSRFARMDEESRKRFRANLKLAEDLGAQIATVYGDDIAAQIAEYAKISGVTKIVLGRTNHRGDLLNPGKNMIGRLTTLAPNLDVYIIPDHQPEYRPDARELLRGISVPRLRTVLPDLLKSLVLVAAATLVGLVIDWAGFTEANIILVYLLAVLVAGIWTGSRLCGVLISLASVLAFNFFFAVPRFTLLAYAPSYSVTFGVMFLSSFLATSLVIRIQRQTREAAQKAYRTEVLLETSRKLQKADSLEAILTAAAEQLQKLLERPVLFYTASPEKRLAEPVCFGLAGEAFPEDGRTKEERAVAEWVYRNNKHAGAATGTLPSARCLYLAVRGQNSVFAVAGIYMEKSARELDAFDKNLMLAILGECGLALEKQSLLEAKNSVELKAQQEQLRANLLRAISHDFRTPLTSISGNAGILMENSIVLEEEKKQKLYADIYDDAMWLVNLVENVLSITRIENGSLNLSLQPELLDDVFREAMRHLDRHISAHRISVELPDDLLMAQMDARLIVQVIINLVNNAVKYTPEGSQIRLGAKRVNGDVEVSVSDDGPGIPGEAESRLFEMFYTMPNSSSDGRRGLGLGLSLCRSIVEAHGGKIRFENCVPHGAKFLFTLKAAEVNAYEQAADPGD